MLIFYTKNWKYLIYGQFTCVYTQERERRIHKNRLGLDELVLDVAALDELDAVELPTVFFFMVEIAAAKSRMNRI